MKYTIEGLTTCYTEDDFIFFWGHTRDKEEKITEKCLSQWWKCNFMENNIIFCCAEQYMMYKKAELFKDYEYAWKILENSEPKEIKRLGRLIRNFDETYWDIYKQAIVLQGNILKFSQNSELKEYLINTKHKILVEASPYDHIWGIGMKKETRGINNPANWRGQNLLGFTIMEVRDRIG